MQLNGRRYLTQGSAIRWHVKRTDKLTFYLLGFSLHLEPLGSSKRYVIDVANYAIDPALLPPLQSPPAPTGALEVWCKLSVCNVARFCNAKLQTSRE